MPQRTIAFHLVTGSAIGRQIEIFAANTNREIDAAFANLLRNRADALLVSPDSLLGNL